MGLAPDGSLIFAQKILDNLIDLKNDGSFRLDQEVFQLCNRPDHDVACLPLICSKRPPTQAGDPAFTA